MHAEPADGDVLDRHHQPLALDEGERDVEVAGQAVLERAVDVDLVERGHDALVRSRSRRARSRAASAFPSCAQISARLAEAHDARHVQRARAHAALVPAAVHLRDEAHARLAPADVQRADPLRAVHLVRGERGEVDVHLLRRRTSTLPIPCTASVWSRTPRSRVILPISSSGWTVPISLFASITRDEDGLVGDRLLHVVRVDPPVLADAEVGDLEALLLEALAGVEDGLVLDHRRDDVVPLLLVELGDPLDREVVALGRARGEDDLLLVLRADELRDPLARVVDGLFRLPAEDVAPAGGVAELRREVRAASPRGRADRPASSSGSP